MFPKMLLSLSVFFCLFLVVDKLAAQDPFVFPPVILFDDTTESQGVAWGDYNNDGWVDLYITRGIEWSGAAVSNLFLKNNNGTLQFTSMGNLTSLVDMSGSASWGDYNNDGFLDLYVAVVAPMSGLNNNLFLNDGSGGFIDKTGSADAGDISNDPEDSGYVGWGDYNNDGFIDMFVDNGKVLAGYPLKEVNSFYENDGDGSFTKKTATDIGNIVSTDDEYKTFRSGFAWCDYNNDGTLDLFNGSGYGSKNKLWKNTGAFFVNTLDFSADLSSTRGVSWGDYDNDGDMDLFISNIIDGDRGYNFLYINHSTPTLDSLEKMESGPSEILTDFFYSGGSVWADFDNDGDLDLFSSTYGNEAGTDFSRLYMNSGYPNYDLRLITSVVDDLDPGDGSGVKNGRAAAAADVDNDGFLDLAISRYGKPLLYMNKGNSNNYVEISLKGNGNTNVAAIGARVFIVANIPEQEGTTKQMREISGQTGAGGQNDLRAHFGLGSATIVDSLIIEWPATGQSEIYTDLAVNNFYSFTESGASAVKPNGNTPQSFHVGQNYPNPFNPTTTIEYDLPALQQVSLKVYDSRGRVVYTIPQQRQSAGHYRIQFDGSNLASGIYYFRLTTNKWTATRKMILAR